MIEITVSNDNFLELCNAKEGEDISIGHIGTNKIVLLKKVCNTTKPKEMTLAELENILGYPIKLIEE